MNAHQACLQRSYGMCEAMVKLNDRMVRCGVRPVEIHHRLTRSRGGDLLDGLPDPYHLMALCNAHHRYAHTYAGPGLMIEGNAWLSVGQIVYSGPDAYLSRLYPLRRPSWTSASSTSLTSRTASSSVPTSGT